jgi:hypothetical protein
MNQEILADQAVVVEFFLTADLFFLMLNDEPQNSGQHQDGQIIASG